MPRLVLMCAAVPCVDGRVQLTRKTLTGLEAFRQRWPGEVVAVARPVRADASANLGADWMPLEDAPVELNLGDPLRAILRLRPDIVQAPFVTTDQPAGTSGVPTVIVVENPALERLRYALASAPLGHAPRMALGAVRQHAALASVLRRAQGVACNGWAAWSAFGRNRGHKVPPLLFFDTRLGAREIAKARSDLNTRTTPHSRKPVLAFSGRFHPAKGPQHAIAASHRLDSNGFEHELLMIGDGPLGPSLRAEAGPSVNFVDPLDFVPGWVDFVRTSIDLMVLPHTQGDPSGTYLESMGLGVPVIGYRNSALSGHERHVKAAWTVPVNDTRALAEAIAGLFQDPALIVAAASRGIQFMGEHGMEKEFDRRTNHLLEVWHSTR